MSDKIKTNFRKYIADNDIKKLKSLVVDSISMNSSLSNLFEEDITCDLFNMQFKTTLLYYLFAVDHYEFSKYLLLKGFNVYRGMICICTYAWMCEYSKFPLSHGMYRRYSKTYDLVHDWHRLRYHAIDLDLPENQSISWIPKDLDNDQQILTRDTFWDSSEKDFFWNYFDIFHILILIEFF